ncbi:membrane protein insertase YidC [Nocardia aurantiaca]|uniref:Membrane protein insertase YidC n=1 Tax=Nocardia aurantiaca TaxID=2675850 RepID=A0A6I3L077_9NOCA|nr:membrane protein insertase YidC [Nocardia aurantiaca]MTE13924.1 membrane protein insertase YidC [Nocardia aurantiaca]
MLDFIYYPVSAVLWLWHTAFASVLGANSGPAWVLAIVFLVMTLRALLIRPYIAQLRFSRALAEMQPQIQEIKRKHAGDREKQALAMQRLQKESGVNVMTGFLPIIGQTLVFIGLYHVLRSFQPGHTENYVFNADQVQSFLHAELFGAPLAATLSTAGSSFGTVAAVAIPLMVIAAVATHFTARAAVARQPQPAEGAAGSQVRIMNTLSQWVFPVGALLVGPVMPIAILLYFVTQNAWTFGQQHLVAARVDPQVAETTA